MWEETFVSQLTLAMSLIEIASGVVDEVALVMAQLTLAHEVELADLLRVSGDFTSPAAIASCLAPRRTLRVD